MKILITGSHGQLGNELTSILASGRSQIGPIDPAYAGCEVTAVDVEELDITDAAAVERFVAQERPDLVINSAAMTNVDGCETNFTVAMAVNALGPRNLAAACERHGAKLVHVSTDYVFGGDGTAPYCEWDATDPHTVYGKSKLLGEQYVREQCRRYFIFRTSWLYGLVGKNFVKTMRMLGSTKDTFTVVNDQRGNPTNANDLAHHILKAALTEQYGLYHCTGEGECSWFEFAQEILRLSGLDQRCTVRPCTTAEYPSKTPRPAFSSLNNLMLACTVGNEMREWKTALADYIERLNEQENA